MKNNIIYEPFYFYTYLYPKRCVKYKTIKARTIKEAILKTMKKYTGTQKVYYGKTSYVVHENKLYRLVN